MAVRLSVLRAGRPSPRRKLKNSNKDLIGNRTRDLPACSIVPQSTTLPRAPKTECVFVGFLVLAGVVTKTFVFYDAMQLVR
jgi:hypothetical protein